jgi:predicted ATPase
MGSEHTQNLCGSELAREEVLLNATNIQQAEALLQQSLTIARTQGALAWELRSATSLAQLWHRQSRCQEALDLLTPIYQRFTEGYATPDLRKVRLLIDELREHVHV